MACYECGHEETPEGRLCPECTKKRLEKKRQLAEGVVPDLEEENDEQPFIKKYRQELIISYALLCIIFVALVIRAIPRTEKIYVMSPDVTAGRVLKYCTNNISLEFVQTVAPESSVAAGIADLQGKIRSASLSPGDKSVDALKEQLSKAMAEFCQAYSNACSSSPDSDECQSILRIMPEKDR